MPAAPTSPSGLPAVDRQWGGLTAGHAYLLVGRAGAGRSALALRTVKVAVDAGERSLVISPREPQELVEVGREVGLDLAAAHTAGALRLLRIPKAAELAARGPEGLAKSYRDLVALVASDGPSRVVVEDFTPLVQFDTFERFHEAFSGLVDALRERGTTLVIGLGDPANDASRRLLEVVEGIVDGTIRLGTGGDLVLSTPHAPAYPSNDGASVEAAAPPEPEPVPLPAADPSGFTTTFTASPEPPRASTPPAEPQPPPEPVEAPPAEAAPAPIAAPLDAPPAETPGLEAPPDAETEPAETEPAGASGPGGPPSAEVVPPPAPDTSLLAPPSDAFGQDPADALFSQGYLADSRGGSGTGTPPPAPASAPAAPAGGVPAFAPLGAAASAPDAGVEFREALETSFRRRATGTPFVVVALRMDPAAPQAARFGAVEAGLRSALRAPDRLLVDAPRKRAAVVLPASGPDAAQALFTALQAHLRNALGPEAEPVLQAVSAVTVPDGQPFQTADELVRYAFEG